MQVATGEVPKAYARQGGWRISVDRAWRSRQMRQTFEADTGTAPLDSTDERRNAYGETAAYYENFLLWATRYLRLEDQAPAPIRAKLLCASSHPLDPHSVATSSQGAGIPPAALLDF